MRDPDHSPPDDEPAANPSPKVVLSRFDRAATVTPAGKLPSSHSDLVLTPDPGSKDPLEGPELGEGRDPGEGEERPEAPATPEVPGGGPEGEGSGVPFPPATGCFSGETPVLMADGSKKRIDDVEVGDVVEARNEHTGELAAHAVTHTFRHLVPETLLLHLEGGASIETTAVHRFAVAEGGFVHASELRPGHKIATHGPGGAVVASLEERTWDTVVHNLTIDRVHTYFVSDERLWVHNVKKPTPTEPAPDP